MITRNFFYIAPLTLVAMGGFGLARADKLPGPDLDPSHIICGEHFRANPRSPLAPAKQCVAAAIAFYEEEWRPQVLGLLAGTPSGFEEIRPPDTFQLPDGTLINGSELPAHGVTIFGTNPGGAVSISNDFTFKPVDSDTILLFGVPKFTFKAQDGSTHVVTSAQFSVYRRTPPGVTNRGWEQLGEFWTYQTAPKGPKPAPPPGAVIPPKAPAGLWLKQVEPTKPAAPAKPGK